MLKIEYSDWKGSEKVLYLQAKTTESKKSMSEEKPYIVSVQVQTSYVQDRGGAKGIDLHP